MKIHLCQRDFHYRKILESLILLFAFGIFSGCGSSGPPALSITTMSLPGGTIGTEYSQTIESTGGVAPLVWSVSSGDLPDNLTLGSNPDNTVTVSGLPDRVQSNVKFTITVMDAKQRSSSQAFSVSIAGTPTIVQTQSGAVQGVDTGNLIAFRGIPYAAPPVGNLRWKAPQPPASWKGVRDASSFGNVCPQIDSAGQYAGDEDCLVLNVYVSQTPPSQSQPVMVFFHGGGNRSGDTQYTPTSLDAPPLANQGVVVVTAEYRLGLLGLLAHPALTAEGGGASGHYLLLDTIAALAWVKQNIAAFGGDPTHVMLFGQSAGSVNVQILLAAPAAQGLFSAAGMESGSIPSPGWYWLPPFATAEASGQQIATALGCGAAADVLACLRALPASTLVNLPNPFSYLYGPGIGSTFLSVNPFTYLQQNGPPVPLLIGSNREEWSLFDDPNSGIDSTAYATAIHQRFDPFGAGVANQVLTLYPASAYSSPAYALIIADTDFNMTCEVRSGARAAASSKRQPVWRYFYTHAFENDPNLAVYGAFHTSELFFLFGTFNDGQQPGGGVVYTPTAADLTFSQSMMGYWTRFAATGNPNGAGAVTWPQYDPATDSMLQLDDTFVTINGYHNPECDYLVTLPQP
ncbi:MAG: carboxylesterase family protein [Candidatus Sulfotelmatobacter sp.]